MYFRVYRRIKDSFIKVQRFQGDRKLLWKKPVGKCQDFRVFQGGGKLLWKKPVGKFQDIRNFNDTSEFLCIKGKCLWEMYD